MKIANRTLLVFDMETGGLCPISTDPIQIAAKAYDLRTLQPIADAEFNSLMRPTSDDRVHDEALKVNKKTREELAKAPEQKVVWKEFVAWVNRFNYGKKEFTAPIAAGKNIRNFDSKFVAELNRKHLNGDKTLLFNKYRDIDLQDYIFSWFENTNELKNEKLDTLADYFGYPSDSLHDALGDVKITGDLIMRFLRLHRDLRGRKKADGTPLIKLGKTGK